MKVSFLSGTRADYSKIKPYIEYLLQKKKKIQVYIFVTGMHVLSKYGMTGKEIEKDFGTCCHVVWDNTFRQMNTSQETSHIISAYDKHLQKDGIDFVFVHGDRPEALAGALTARLNNIPVCQIEAGDLSGSIDDSIRHSITKLAHRFFVTDVAAKKVLLKSGENAENIFIVGNSSLANVASYAVMTQQKIPFQKYAILIYHPVTTLSKKAIQQEIKTLMKNLVKSGRNYVVIMPNNDLNSDAILDEYKKYMNHPHFCFFKSLPLDVFTNILKGSQFLIGNSSCGIKEAPYYSVPVIDVGLRQKNRHIPSPFSFYFYHLENLQNLDVVIKKISLQKTKQKSKDYRQLFFKKLDLVFRDDFWKPKIQKSLF